MNTSKLQQWLSEQYNLCTSQIELQPLNNDASFRKYYRIKIHDKSLIAVDSPPNTEKNGEFIAVQCILQNKQVRVPQIIKYDEQYGFFVLEDFGDQILLPILKQHNANPYLLYGKCVAELLKIQKCNNDSQNYSLPLYDHKLLTYEMELFREWFLAKYLRLSLTAEQHDLLTNIFDVMLKNVDAQPQVLVHRDYHSRNLMQVNNEANLQIGVIDFQDAVFGPVTYDLVSLFRDCYIEWPIARVEQWVSDYFVQAKLLKILDHDLDFAQFWSWFLQMTLQRNFKTIGIFARLYLRDNKSGYLADIPRTLGYALEVTKILSLQKDSSDWIQFININKLLSDLIKPALHQKNNSCQLIF